MTPISPRERDALRFVVSFLKAHGYAPSHFEIAKALGVSKPVARDKLRQLARKGYLYCEPAKARAIVVLRVPDDMNAGVA